MAYCVLQCDVWQIHSRQCQGPSRCCLFWASTSQGPVNHKPNESQINTAAFADQSVISCAHWSLAEAIILSSATNSPFLSLIMLHKLHRLKILGFDIFRRFLKILRRWIKLRHGWMLMWKSPWVTICMIAWRERPACSHWIVILFSLLLLTTLHCI